MAVRVLKGPFTVESYQRLAELGVLQEDDRVELIGGQVVEMTPIGDRHAACVRRLERWFHDLHELAVVSVQNPVVLDEHHAPQPDVVLLKPRADTYLRHPRPADVLLVVEVAETSLAYDRAIKIPLYAQAGIPEAWLVDLPADQIRVCREPVAGRYTGVRTATRGDTVAPLNFPDLRLSVDAILG